MDEIEKFQVEKIQRIQTYKTNKKLQASAKAFLNESFDPKYSYNFSWMGRPIIQYPQDIVAMQEIIWNVQPDLIIEIGIAHGGGLIFYASLLELIGTGEVLGVDIDIREHNRREIENHPMYDRITMIEGSSIDECIVKKVAEFAQGKNTVLVTLDSNHTHNHVAKELEYYASLVTTGSYLVVFDTVIEDMPDEFFDDRPWGKGDNPKTAVHAFLKENSDFEVDELIQNKLLITVTPDGYLKRVK